MSVPDRERRTIEPTPKRVDDFRKRGEIALSRDLTQVATMIAGATLGLIFAKGSVADIGGLAIESFRTLELGGLDQNRVIASLIRAGLVFAYAVAPVAIGAFVGYVVSTAIQLGFPPAFLTPKFDLSKTFSVQAIANLLSPKAAAGRALKALGKLAFIGLVLAYVLDQEQERFNLSPALGATALVARILGSLGRLTAYAGGALALLALADYLWTRREIRARMRMTPDEMKREMKENDGDPQIKRKRKQRMRELAKQRLTQAVKSADVVIVNPTEYAVALRYRSSEDRAPRVVAKGRRALAERIREIARTAGVPIMAQPPLTRLIYKVVPLNREIPAHLYRAVAEVLGYVHRLKARRGR